MKVTVRGKVLEKYSREGKTTDGTKIEKLFVRLYQPGQRVNLDVNVNASTFTQLDVGEEVELDDISISTYNDNLYAKQ